MKQYFLFEAVTSSEWDLCSFALVEMDEKFINYLQTLRAELLRVKKSHNVDQFLIYADNAMFFTEVEELPDFCFDNGKLTEKIISLPDEVVASFTQPEQVIKYGHMKVNEFRIQFVGYGKHTDEEFWGEIPFDALLQHTINPLIH